MELELGGGKEILVRAVKRKEEGGVMYWEHVLYKCDIGTLESETALTPCCPSLLNKVGNGDGVMVKLGGSSIIYVITSRYRWLDDYLSRSRQREEEDPSPNSIGSLAVLKHAAWIDLSEDHPKWRSAPCATHNIRDPFCVSVCGKIYSLGSAAFKPEVYNHPNTQNDNAGENGGGATATHNSGDGGFWVELPRPPTKLRSSCVNMYPLPDPEHDQIIAHVNSAIYAFKPSSNNQWERLSPPDCPFTYWDMCSAVANGLLCIARDGRIRSVAAYDLADSTRPLDVKWSNTYPDRIREFEFDTMINLGNGFLCLALSVALHLCTDPVPLDPDRTRICLAVFSFKRQTHDLVTFTYHCFRCYDLFATNSVIDYVSLGE